MYVQWDTVDLFPPTAPEIKEKRKADRHLVQVHQTNSRAVSLKKDVGTLFAYHRLWAFTPPALHTAGI